ncbi:cytochrome-c peroxidase [Acaryochloris sp. IP29b_bin.148]|uniref:cytochrome-c peroxidase n=1 Tax=Acaryochloris sp. IP29b_bin.148 TaxID=2969218 RepID=UPI00261E8AEF|nr:cytochrome-c peroxidase [Acaryochloris sp. IP29b_bin.148]
MGRIHRQRHWLMVILFSLVILLSWQWSLVVKMPVSAQWDLTTRTAEDQPIEPIPLHLSLNLEKVVLGKQLFHDPKLSRTSTVSCASCHNLATGGVDRRSRSRGVNGQIGTVNALTVLNSGFQFKQFWDGRAASLEEQIDGPIHDETEMGSNWPEIIERLNQSPDYVRTFNQIYHEDISADHIKDAIATFERSLYTPNARFDQFLRGNTHALTNTEKKGYQRFKAYGCVACHQGMLLGGNMYQKFGIFGDYIKDRGNESKADWGRYNVTGKAKDRYVFKVPSLRNVISTAPYFHDGSAKTLDEAIKIMIRYQLGREANQNDVDLIIQFFQTLSGELNEVPS